MRGAAWICLLLAGLFGCAEPAPAPIQEAGDASPDAPLNVVVVLSDALRAASLPFHGYPRDTAPFLGRLADEGLLFEQHLANYPATPVSVSQLMTGRLMPPLLMGGSWALAPVRRVEDDLPILPRILRQAGYRTALVSSHVWFDDSARVLEHFDEHTVLEPPEGEAYAPFEDLLAPAFDFLDARAGDRQPFFLYLHSLDTHAPFHARSGPPPWMPSDTSEPEWPEEYDRYDAEIAYTDRGVERLVEGLDRLGLWGSTLFVFTSDHGEDLHELGEKWWHAGHGSTLHRSLLHIPLILHGPPSLGLHGRVAVASRHVDLLPTLLGLLGLDAARERFRFDGRDLLEAPRDSAAPDSLAFSWRYWSLYRGEVEAIYDQWEDRLTLYRSVPDERNYPHPEEIDDPELAAELERLLMRERREHLRRFLALPPVAPRSAIVGIPTTVVHGETEAIPTFGAAALDGRWSLQNHQLLLCDPREKPPPLVLAAPWAPGTYRVAVRHAGGNLYPSRFRLAFTASSGGEIEVDVRDADDEGWVDLGVHRLGDPLKIRIRDPRGGVAISALRLELVGAGSAGETGPDDEELEERLRALGYVR